MSTNFGNPMRCYIILVLQLKITAYRNTFFPRTKSDWKQLNYNILEKVTFFFTISVPFALYSLMFQFFHKSQRKNIKKCEINTGLRWKCFTAYLHSTSHNAFTSLLNIWKLIKKKLSNSLMSSNFEIDGWMIVSFC